MKHHFADLLDRTGDYWTIVPNRERFVYSIENQVTNKQSIKILTISKTDKNWQQIFDCPNIEEITLHEPSMEQVLGIKKLTQLKRLRITFFRARDIEFISSLSNLEELILEYVSGFSDLSPLKNLRRIKSLHLENLRRITNFDGLKELNSLRYLYINGTLDWKQPIENFYFLESLNNLEVLSLGFVINKSDFPAFLPVLNLRKIKKIRIGLATFNTKEYAFLETAFPNGICCSFGDLPWTPCYKISDGYIEFIGKGAGNVKLDKVNAAEKIEAFEQKYKIYKQESEQIIKKQIK